MLEAPGYARTWIPRGEPGIRRSVGVVRQLARLDSSHPLVRNATGRLSWGVGPYDHSERLARIKRFLLDHFQYHPDPRGTEFIGAPSFHVHNINADGMTLGDCDDAAALGAAMGLSVGRPSRLNVVSYRPDKRFHHIFAEANDGERWISLDPFRGESYNRAPTRYELVGV